MRNERSRIENDSTTNANKQDPDELSLPQERRSAPNGYEEDVTRKGATCSMRNHLKAYANGGASSSSNPSPAASAPKAKGEAKAKAKPARPEAGPAHGGRLLVACGELAASPHTLTATRTGLPRHF